MQSNNRNEKDLLIEALGLYYGENARIKSRDVKPAVEQMIRFYACGKLPHEIMQKSKQNQVHSDNRVYDYMIDAAYIYAAFYQTYQIDLQELKYMHWWKFSALFKSLPDDCKVVQIMHLRAKNLSEIKDQKERSRIAEEQAKWALPSRLTPEQKISLAGSLFGKGLPVAENKGENK